MAYFSAKNCGKKLGVPVGLIKSSVGGTVAEAWTPPAELEGNPVLKPLLDQQVASVAGYPKALETYKQQEAELTARYEKVWPRPRLPALRSRESLSRLKIRLSNNRPTGLYNGSIAPLEPYAIRGVIWYQGESNSSRGKEYQTCSPQ